MKSGIPMPKNDLVSFSEEIWSGNGGPDGNPTPPPEELLNSYFDVRRSLIKNPVLQSEKPFVVVVGIGYVGMHLVEAFSQFYDMAAYDTSKERLLAVAPQLAHLPHVVPTNDPSHFGRATHFIISVPTLVSHAGKTDTSSIRAALANIAIWARPKSTVIIESSVSVGTTRNLLHDLVLAGNLKGGMSPERVDPGRTDPCYKDIPKIVSGLDDIAPGSLAAVKELYAPVFRNIVAVSKPEVAEMTKLYENCQRMVCIAYANEMADACVSLGLDPFEVSEAAASKPFGYLPMRPSAGVGGHCIPVNPYYLFSTCDFPLLRRATNSMAHRPQKIVDRAMTSLKAQKPWQCRSQSSTGDERRPRVLVVGMGFKRGQSLLSHSPGVAMVQHLSSNYDADVMWADTLVPKDSIPTTPKLESQHWHTLGLSWFDLVIVATKQVGYDYTVLSRLRRTIVEEWSR